MFFEFAVISTSPDRTGTSQKPRLSREAPLHNATYTGDLTINYDGQNTSVTSLAMAELRSCTNPIYAPVLKLFALTKNSSQSSDLNF